MLRNAQQNARNLRVNERLESSEVSKEEKLPWWALISFGSYSLGNIGYHLYRFRDCNDAYHELMEEIQSAKNDLRAKGVLVD
ncbi:3791_t:CDS:2 [Cetraspora pellucida]|uniref:Dolichol-phosphate mannosyltransferase subunit 3 n=1 Tax=Cetraspora pellucida TaxID=1433469 RepID=A0A9N9FDW6_9GLOM|nr:3791_t:CDS:2 [Cetraspora pellucida]